MERGFTIANAFKSYATRKLRERGLIGKDVRPWARGKSRRYLWKPKHVLRAIDYVPWTRWHSGFWRL